MSMSSDVLIELHADDYGETLNTSRGILKLMQEGCLDGISILGNMSDFDAYARMLIDAVPTLPFVPYMSVHLDLVEGCGLSESTSEDTTDGYAIGDYLPWSFKKLYMVSYYLPVRDRNGNRMNYRTVYERLVSEIRFQIRRVSGLIDEVIRIAGESGIPCRSAGLRIDAHQHAHLIPIVWKALMQVIDEDSLDIEYIRTAHEPIGVFARHFAITFSPIGIVKNRLLAFHAPKAERFVSSKGRKPAYLWGLIMSGHMDMDRIEKIMPDMLKICTAKGYDLEINIHPGRMLESELCAEIPEDSARTFYMTKDRDMETEMARVFHNRMFLDDKE